VIRWGLVKWRYERLRTFGERLMQVCRAVGVISVFGGNFRSELDRSTVVGFLGLGFDMSSLWIR
jgi:hypothetical protein